jgi:hypothetical protein
LIVTTTLVAPVTAGIVMVCVVQVNTAHDCVVGGFSHSDGGVSSPLVATVKVVVSVMYGSSS